MQKMRLIRLQEKKARNLFVLSDKSWKINQCVEVLAHVTLIKVAQYDPVFFKDIYCLCVTNNCYLESISVGVTFMARSCE